MPLRQKFPTPIIYLWLGLLYFAGCQAKHKQPAEEKILSFIADPATDDIRFYWKDDQGKPFRNLQTLKKHLEANGKKLRFAVNGGMYMEHNIPLGLYVQNSDQLRPLNTRSGQSNFYMEPNGVFYLTTGGRAGIVPTAQFAGLDSVKYATQSGPMLVVDGAINPLFKDGSANLNVRNGVGILPDGKVLFAMSKQETNFYDFALYFKNQGCPQALYLDGFVSRTYLPEKNWQQLSGDFGVIIGVTE